MKKSYIASLTKKINQLTYITHFIPMRQQHTILPVYAAKKIAQKTKLNIQVAKKGAQFDQLLFYLCLMFFI